MMIDDTSNRLGTDPQTCPQLPPGPPEERGKTRQGRVRGLDAARGFALFGMVLVHVMPENDPVSGSISPLHQFFAGHSAPLFAVLAGVSLALITGAASPHTGRQLTRDRAAILTRALLLLICGLSLNLLQLNVFSILPFYAVYFLIGIPFLSLGVRALLAWAGLFALAGPVVIHLVNGLENVELLRSPDLGDLFTDPLMTALSLTATGYYPAVTWMAYILLGLALGRLSLSGVTTQIRMCVGGAVAAGAAALASGLLMFPLGAYERILSVSSLTEGEITKTLEFGGPVPVDSWAWLATDAPHTNTPFSVIGAAGWAVLALGGFLLATRVAESALAPLAAAGSMTFTFYTAHLLLVTFVNVWAMPVFWTLAQIVFASVFALVWRAVVGQGPLESLMSRTSKGTARVLVPEPSPPKEGGKDDR